MDITIGADDKSVTLKGRDGKQIIREDVWDLREYLKSARKYNKYVERINREKEKHGIDSYNYERLDELVMQKSVAINGRLLSRGLENRLKTIEKVLAKDPITKKNKIQSAAENMLYLRKLKYEAMDDPHMVMKKAGIDISPYVRKNGNFRSAKAEREYLKLMSEVTSDESHSPSDEFGEFFGFIYDNYVDKDQTTKQFWAGTTQDERLELMRDYLTNLAQMDLKVENEEEEARSFEAKFDKKPKKYRRRK